MSENTEKNADGAGARIYTPITRDEALALKALIEERYGKSDWLLIDFNVFPALRDKPMRIDGVMVKLAMPDDAKAHATIDAWARIEMPWMRSDEKVVPWKFEVNWGAHGSCNLKHTRNYACLILRACEIMDFIKDYIEALPLKGDVAGSPITTPASSPIKEKKLVGADKNGNVTLVPVDSKPDNIKECGEVAEHCDGGNGCYGGCISHMIDKKPNVMPKECRKCLCRTCSRGKCPPSDKWGFKK